MAWFGRRHRSIRRRGAMVVAATVAAVAVAVTAPPSAGASPVQAADSTRALPGFLFSEGRYTVLEAPDADAEIRPSGINESGQITGEYMRSDRESGFVRDPDGTITTFDVPGAEGTKAIKINDRGQIVGRYSDDTPFVDNSTRVRGYVRYRGRTTRIDFPGASHTRPTGINDQGDVVGSYVDADGTTHGFLWRNRRFTAIDFQGATSPMPVDINEHGQVIGLYLDDAGEAHSFLLNEDRYTTISVPGAAPTHPSDINDLGQIVGYTAEDLELTGARGFRRLPGSPADYSAVNVPDAPRTLPLGMNDRGDIVGLNENPVPTPTSPDTREQWPGMSSGLDLRTVRGITVDAAIADDVEALLAAAEADGIGLTGSGYRDNARQIELRRAHCGTSYYAIYEMPSRDCSPPTARPGTSRHERGVAIDFSCGADLIRSRSDPCFVWLDANAATYGLYNLPSETWHWSIDGK